MPKGRKIVKTNNSIKKVNVKRSLRIGTRKAGVSANTLSSTKLLESLKDTNKKKWHASARTVLTNRGVSL